MSLTTKKKYDIVLFGVTGFTGKLAAEYLLQHHRKESLRWAVCARNKSKAQEVLKDLYQGTKTEKQPDILVANLQCRDAAEEDALKEIVAQTKVVVTCAGPFEKYGLFLVRFCAELGVHYADITGETDFVRKSIRDYDKKAQSTGAKIVHHCGNDCIPQDITVFEMNALARERDCELVTVQTFVEVPESTTVSGGTLATATFQLNKDRSRADDQAGFDPLLTTLEGVKSEYTTTNVSPRESSYVPELACKAGPWIMGPVMVNCVRRSNALLQYSKSLQYGDAQLHKHSTLMGWFKQTGNTALLGAAITAPSVFSRFMPAPGEGPDRATMEDGYLVLHGLGVMRKLSTDKEELHVRSTFRFNKDIGYLYTAALVVESGILLLESTTKHGGVLTPAATFGNQLTKRIVSMLDATFDLEVEEN